MSFRKVFARWIRELIAPARDPRLSYQDALDRHQVMIVGVRQARASLGTARARLETQLEGVKQSQPAATDDQEDPFQQQLQRLVSEGVSDLEEELAQLSRDDQQLDLAERRLLAEDQALRARREALAAHKIASQARTRVHEQLDAAVYSNRFGSLLEEAKRRTDGIEDKLAAAANLTGLIAFAGAGSGEAQGLAMRFLAAGRTETSRQRKRLLASGFRCLLDLEAEHTQLQSLIQRSASDELLASTYIQTLATETHSRAVRLLADALVTIAPLSEAGGMKSTLEPEPDQESRASGLIEQAHKCIAAVKQTRIDLSNVKAHGSRKQAEAAITALRNATENAKSIEAELEGLKS